MKLFSSLTSLLVCFTFLLHAAPAGAALGRSDGADLVFGGAGAGPGQFRVVRDMAFDKNDVLHVLEANGPLKGRDIQTEHQGVARVQRFSSEGKFLGQFGLGDDIVAEKGGGPQRLAVDSAGRVAVTLPRQDTVRIFDSQGIARRDVKVPDAFAIGVTRGTGKERFVVFTGQRRVVPGKGWQNMGGDALYLLDAEEGAPEVVPLTRKLEQVKDMAVGPDGTFFVLASWQQIYRFDVSGRLLSVLGSGTQAVHPAMDGSSALDSVAVDSLGNVYSIAGGNPISVSLYSADGKTVRQRRGQFKWADTWNGGYAVLLALDKTDRVWAMTTMISEPEKSKGYHFSPAVIRTVPDFLKTGTRGVTTRDARLMGFGGKVVSAAVDNTTYDLSPVTAEFVISPANRMVQEVRVDYTVYDWKKQAVGRGGQSVPLTDGEQSRVPLSFTPPQFGWYTAEIKVTTGKDPLVSYGHHFAVTPPFAGLVQPKAGEANGSWEDPARQMFAGLPNYRLHLGGLTPQQVQKSAEKLLKDIEKAEGLGTTVFLQLAGSDKELNVERIGPALELLKGKAKYIELCNEPNFFFSPQSYVERAREVYALIKTVDPQVRVLGPAVCGMQLPWHTQFFQAGGAQTFDEFSTHDYEGHESITPEHWYWKVGEIRKLLAQHGKANVPFWQTERAIAAVRGGFMGPQQAIRITLRYDLMESLGVPAERNNHYYLNEGGYSTVPSYMWSKQGPFPAALAMRTRYAMTRGRAYQKKLNFGTTGDELFFGLQYGARDGDGGLVSLRNLGERDLELLLNVRGGGAMRCHDSWGNAVSLPVQDGQVRLSVGQMPLYLELAAGQSAVPVPWNLGRNLAPAAEVKYLGTSSKDILWLTNGIIETHHGDNPNGDTNGAKIWAGEEVSPQTPRTLELRWPRARTFHGVLLNSPRSDNIFCGLLDFDVQIPQGDGWKNIAEVRTDLPESYPAEMGDAFFVQWHLDDSVRLARFAPVTSDALRIVVHRTTYGAYADKAADTLVRRMLSKPPPAVLMLREIKVLEAPSPLTLAAESAAAGQEVWFPRDRVTLALGSGAALQGEIRALAPAGWQVSPATLPVSAAAGGTARHDFTVTPAPQVPVGKAVVDFGLYDAAGRLVAVEGVAYRFQAPLSFSPQAPAIAAQGPQLLSLKLKNTAAHPLEGEVRLTLQGPEQLAPLRQTLPTLASWQEQTLTFEVPGLVLSNARWLARYEATVNGIIQEVEQDLSVRPWLVVGPFENDFDKDFGPEKAVDLAQKFSDMMGNEQKWRTASSEPSGLLDFLKVFDRKQDASAYAAAWVYSTGPRSVVLSSGSDDGGKIWFNGELVVNQNTRRGPQPGQDKVPVDLKAGWNSILIKVTQSDGGWGFYFDLLDPATQAVLRDLKYSTTPPAPR